MVSFTKLNAQFSSCDNEINYCEYRKEMTKTFEHILVPYNGTAGSEKAFRKAISLSEPIQAKITILTCVEERQTFGFFKTKASKQEFEKERKIIEKQHLKLEKFAKEHDVSCGSKIVKNGLASPKFLNLQNNIR